MCYIVARSLAAEFEQLGRALLKRIVDKFFIDNPYGDISCGVEMESIQSGKCSRQYCTGYHVHQWLQDVRISPVNSINSLCPYVLSTHCIYNLIIAGSQKAQEGYKSHDLFCCSTVCKSFHL